MLRIPGWLFFWGMLLVSGTAAQGSDSGFRAPESCDSAYAACAAAQRLEKARPSRYTTAALSCRSHLDTALDLEDQLNSEIDTWRELRGRASDDYYRATIEPINTQRNAALQTFRSCSEEAVQDLRPDDYPRSDLLLNGGVSSVETPDGSFADVLQAANDALDPVAEPLQNLSRFLDAIAPHYDMTSRSDTGIRVVQDILIDMGVGHLIGQVPTALRAMARTSDEIAVGTARATASATTVVDVTPGNATPRLGNEPFSQSTRNVRSTHAGAANSYWNLPEGMPLPPMLANTPRPLYLQEQTHSCVQACVRMVTDTVNRMPMREGFLRTVTGEAYTAGEGTGELAISRLLNDVGIPNQGWATTTVDDLADAVSTGYPAIVTYGSAHASVVDAVAEFGGQRWVFLRNPANPGHFTGELAPFMQALGFRNYDVVPESAFLGSFTAGGSKAVFTNPAL